MHLPFRIHDLLLIIVVLSSMTTSVLYPEFGALFQSLPIYCVTILFFLSYLTIDLQTVWKVLRNHHREILSFTIMKMFLMPILLFFLFNQFFPDYALSALLLTGVSTGVIATFVSNLVKGNSSMVLVVVVITSFLAPFTLPLLVQTIAVQQVEVSLSGMIRMLSMVIFVPILAVELLRRLKHNPLNLLMTYQFPLSLILIGVINLGIFFRYAPIFKKDPFVILMSFLIAVTLSALYCLIGVLFFRKSAIQNQMAGAVMLGNMNNVLIAVFSSQFFGPIEPLVSSMYTIPFFGLIIPLRYYYHKKTRLL